MAGGALNAIRPRLGLQLIRQTFGFYLVMQHA
jgi:hypothetical protein